MILGAFLIGPWKYVTIQRVGALTLIGLSILGIACATIIIPVMPEMIESVEHEYSQNDMMALHSMISGIFVFS